MVFAPRTLGVRIAVVLIANWCVAHSALAAKSGTPETARRAKPTVAATKFTTQQERGLRLLKAAEAEAAGLEADMRAFVLWRASYAYATIDPKKAQSLARQSFNASEAIEEPSDHDQCGPIGGAGDIKSWIQERVLSGMIKKEQVAQAEELLPRATTPVRNHITTELVRHYLSKKNLERALIHCFLNWRRAISTHSVQRRTDCWRWVPGRQRTE